jgi:diguanylate cyclase
MLAITYILPWVLASVCIGIAAGFYLGRGTKGAEGSQARPDTRDRETTLKVLAELLRATEQMMSDVECHNSEFRRTSRDVAGLPSTGDMEHVKRALLDNVERLLHSNKRLQNDLMCSRYEMEEQAQQLDHVRREARTDALTTVANRKAFDEKLHVLRTFWERQRQEFVLVLLDLDHFKWINDAHGHVVGDNILAMLGTWLKEWVREGDMVARYGGDEFAVLLPRTSVDVGVERAETIRARTAERASHLSLRGEQISLSLSVGVASPQEGDTEESLLTRADEALYHSKHAGRNHVSMHRDGTAVTFSNRPGLGRAENAEPVESSLTEDEAALAAAR